MNNVRKITNTSNASIGVDVDPQTRIYIGPGEVIENRKIYNLGSIRQFCKVEEDLGEVAPLKEGRQYLKG